MNTAAPMLALILLFICVSLFSFSYHYSWLKRNVRYLLWVLGVIPGGIGAVWGLWRYIELRESQLMSSASGLLVLGVLFLATVVKNEKRT